MSQNQQHLIKLRGLPWTVSADDIQNFLKEVKINEGTKGIHLSISGHDGRPNGEAFVECASEDDFNRAFDYNKNVMGHRYIEVFSAKLEEFEFVMKRQNVVNHDTFVKLRGLPWNTSAEDIIDFFEGMEIRNGKEGIHSVVDNKGKSTGEAFVQFTSPEDTENALKKNREKISHRYIEIFRSSSSECRRATVFTRPPAGMDRMNNGMNNGRNFGGGNFGGGNSRGGGGGGGPGRNQNNRNFRDKPYDTNWNSDGGSSRPRNNFNNNMNQMNDNFNNGNNDGFSGNNNNNFNNFGGNSNNGNSMDRFNNSSSFGSGNSNHSGNRGFNNSPRNNFGGSNDSDFIGNNGNNQNNLNNFGGGGNNRNFGGNNFGNSFSNNANMGNIGNNIGIGGMGNRPNLMNSGNNNMNNGNGRNNMGFGNNNSRNWNNDNSSDGGKFCVHLRGMPFDCGEKEVFMFFEPINVLHCDVQYNDNGRHTGEADAFFGSYDDAQEAMKRHKQKMGARWIELFFNNPNSRNDRQMGGGIGNNGNQMGNRNRF